MIITLLLVAITIMLVVKIYIKESEYKYYDIEVESGLAIIMIIILTINFAVIVTSHVGVDNNIRQCEIVYQSLIDRQEILNSDYEDVSRSEVIKDIAEWNSKVQLKKYWGYNPWTSWYFSRRLVDSLKFIE